MVRGGDEAPSASVLDAAEKRKKSCLLVEKKKNSAQQPPKSNNLLVNCCKKDLLRRSSSGIVASKKKRKKVKCLSQLVAPRLSWELVAFILEFAMDVAPAPETAHLWPVARPLEGTEAHLLLNDEVLAIRPRDFDCLKKSQEDETFRLRGFWAAETETAVRSFLCVDEADVDLEDPALSLKGERVYWLRRGFADSGAARLVCCSVTRDAIRGGLQNPSVAAGPQQRTVDVDVLGIDYGTNGKNFTFVPKGATVSKAIRCHFAKTIRVKHRLAEFVQADKSNDGFWVTTKTRQDTLDIDKLLPGAAAAGLEQGGPIIPPEDSPSSNDVSD